MPKVERPVPESDQAIVRPIAIAVIQEVMMNRLGLPATTAITYPGYTETIAQPHGFISNPYEQNRFPTTDKLFLEVTENYVEDLLPGTSTNSLEHVPLWLNEDLEICIVPIYFSVEMKFTIHYRAKNKTDARRFYDMMIMKLPKREDTWLHTLKYSYGIPESYMKILEGIHELVEKQEGYGEDFNTFFRKWANPRYGELTDQVGKNTTGVFSDTQERCIGFFDDPITPDWGNRKDETDVWEVQFPYVVRYEKPKDVYFDYPIVIHNQVLSSKYRGKKGFERVEDTQAFRSKSMHHLKNFESMNNADRHVKDQPGRYFPLYDEFIPRNIPRETIRVFTALVMLDDEKPNLLMNIADLEGPSFGFRVTDAIKKYMSEQCDKVTIPREAAVQISFYMGRNLMHPDFIRMDKDLNIYSTRPLSKRKYYHIRMSIVTDLLYLTEPATTEIRKYPDVVKSVIDYILPENVVKPEIKVVVGEVDPRNYDEVATTIKKRGQLTNASQMKTVQFSQLNAIYSHQR